MGLWDVVTGKRYKDNQLTGAMSENALVTYSTLCECGLQGTLKAFALALITAIPDTGKLMFRDSKTPEYIAIGKSLSRDTLLRFAAYMAWFVHDRWVDRNRESLCNEAGELDETGRAMLADMQRIRVAVYPDGEEAVQAAIARAKANDELGLDDGSDAALMRYNEEFWLILNALLGLPEPPQDLRARLERTLEVGRVQTFAINVFSEMFATLANDPSMMR